MATKLGILTLGNGVNLQPSYYNPAHVSFGWSLMKQYTKIQTVRIEIEPDRVNEAKTWIAAAQAQGYKVVATYHKWKAIGSNDINELLSAAHWWVSNYHVLGGNFIINVMNEWGDHNVTPEQYSAAYNQAIGLIRNVYHDFLIVDLPGWGRMFVRRVRLL